MLRSLSVKNYAIIDALDIEFCHHLNIITGETGAGKSILVGALSLILGKRADSQVLHDKSSKCIVEATFDIAAHGLEQFFAENELDYDSSTIIRRELTPSGKSRAFINDTPVKLSVLRSLSNRLVSLHSQHEVLELMSTDFQINALDQLCKHGDLLSGYQRAFTSYGTNVSRLEKLQKAANQNQKDLDYFQFQLNELLEVGLTEEEQVQLEEELNSLTHAEEIASNLRSALTLLDQKDASAIDSLNAVSASLDHLAEYSNEFKEIAGRLNSCIIELTELTRDLEDLEGSTVFDEKRIQQINERLNDIYRLEKKHGVESVGELIQIRDELNEKVQSIDASADEIIALQQVISGQEVELKRMALELRENRLAAKPDFEQAIMKILREVGMPNASFNIAIVSLEDLQFHKNGLDKIAFLFSANKGAAPQPINKVASGGELSRLMLAIKSQMAENVSMPTLIFDEIDTGISGEVAGKVGAILQKMSKNHQLISITHLPQIASKADRHFYVFKESAKKKTSTKIKTLSEADQLVEIAKMLSGDKVSDAALANAKELLN